MNWKDKEKHEDVHENESSSFFTYRTQEKIMSQHPIQQK